MTQRKVVPKEIKNEVLAKVKGGEKVADLARQYGISDKSGLHLAAPRQRGSSHINYPIQSVKTRE